MPPVNLKLLLIHNYSRVQGGADRCVHNLKSLLESKGHEVAIFTAEGQVGLLRSRPTDAIRYLYNRRAAKKLNAFLNEFRPDIAHCHNIYGHLTPAILPVLKRHNIPVVLTLHDYKLICPNHMLYTHGGICERCKGGHYYRSFKNRCFKNSYLLSFLGMTEAYLHHWLKIYEKNIDVFISPSRFLRTKFLEFGWPSERIQWIPNFAPLDVSSRETPSCHGFICFGAVNEIKGVPWLLRSLETISEPVHLKIVGEGNGLGESLHLAKPSHHKIEFLPFQPPTELYQNIQSALFTVVPSLWYENNPMTILESYALGRSVVAPNQGGIPELIEHGRTGLLFEAGNSRSLTDQIRQLLQNPQKALDMGRQAKEKFEKEFNAELHYQRILKIYQELSALKTDPPMGDPRHLSRYFP